MSRIRSVSRRQATEPRTRRRFPARAADRRAGKAALLRATLCAMAETMEQAEPAFMTLERNLSGAPARLLRDLARTIATLRTITRAWRRASGGIRAARVNRVTTLFEWRHEPYYPQIGACLMSVNIMKMSMSKVGSNSLLSAERIDECNDAIDHVLSLAWVSGLALTNVTLYVLNLLSAPGRNELSRSCAQRANLFDQVLDARRGSLGITRYRRLEVACDEASVASLPEVRGDVGTVVANLICNAVRYAPESSIITVAGVRSEDGRLCGLAVENRSSRIRPFELRRVFEPGYRRDRTAPGVGLGLFIVKELVELSGGRVEISTTLIDDEAATIRVTALFPVAVA